MTISIIPGPLITLLKLEVTPRLRLYTDAWGPSPHRKFNGFKWFLLCIDDYSRFSRICPLTNKSEVIRVVIGFTQKIKRQFKVGIMYFLIDNAWLQ